MVECRYVINREGLHTNYGIIKLNKWPFLMPVQAPIGDTFHYYAWRQRFHYGMDIGNWSYYRDNIRCPCAGKVIECDLTSTGYGRLVRIEVAGLNNGYKLEVRLAHLFKHFLKPNQLVKKGMIIAEVGGRPGDQGAGSTTAPHLHLELWAKKTIKNKVVFYQPIDPIPLFT